MCCVIPPASDAATFFCLIASSIEVLPWSTCPITVTTGGLSLSSFVLSLGPSRPTSTSDSLTLFGVWPNSRTNSSAVSASIVWFIVAITPSFIRLFIKFEDFSANLEASSPTVITSGIMISFFFFSFVSRFSLDSGWSNFLCLAFSLALLIAAKDLTFSLSSSKAWDIVSFPCLLFSKLLGLLGNLGGLFFSGDSCCISFWFFFGSSVGLLVGFFGERLTFKSLMPSFGALGKSGSIFLKYFISSFNTSLPSFWSSLGFLLIVEKVLFFFTSTDTDLLLPCEKFCFIWPALNVFLSWSLPVIVVFLSLFSSIFFKTSVS